MSPSAGVLETTRPAVPAGVGLESAGAGPTPQEPHSLLQAFQSLLYVIVVALFLITFTVQPFRIPSESMEPTLLVGDFLLVNKQVTSDPVVHSPAGILPASAIRRGDLIVFHYPVDPTMHLVKRVIGLPGDHLRLRDGRVFIDDRPLTEPYAMYRPAGPDTYRDDFPRLSSTDPGVDSRWWIQMHTLVAHGELTVPPDSYFVLGDNRNDSEDSRYWGFVPRAAIVGKPFVIYFSLRNPAPAPDTHSAFAQDRGLDESSSNEARPGPDSPAQALTHFARWERALQIIQ